MLPETPRLLSRVLSAPDSAAARVRELHSAYSGRTCYLVTCGPSLNDIDASDLRTTLRGELVIAVKQAYDILHGVADFHLLNSTSFKRYQYVEPRPIVLFERGEADAPVWECTPDISFLVTGANPRVSREVRLAERLALTERYDDYLMESNVGRPWGPGIVLELGIYLAVHLRVSRLVVIGWDLGPPHQSIYNHFYGSHGRFSQGPAGLFLRRVLRRGPFRALQYLRHIRGQAYNLGTVEPDDTAISVASSYGMFQWLASRGVTLELVGPKSHLDARIPRIAWESIRAQLR